MRSFARGTKAVLYKKLERESVRKHTFVQDFGG